MQDKGMLNDVNNKLSAKRIWAGRYLWVGLIMAIGWFALSVGAVILNKELNMKFPFEMWFGLLGLGGGLLGFTIFETKNK